MKLKRRRSYSKESKDEKSKDEDSATKKGQKIPKKKLKHQKETLLKWLQ